MRFERTKGSLVNLNSGEISADALLDMLVRVTQDIYEANHITRASALNVVDQKSLLMNLYNLSTTMLTIFQTNQDAVSQFPGFIQNKIRSSMEELSAREEALSGIMGEIQREEAQQEKLRIVHQKLEKSRGHLLSVKEDCILIHQRIEELNDARLDEMAFEKESLEAELASRKNKAEELADQKMLLCKDLEQMQARLNVIQEQNASVEKELNQKETAEQQAQLKLEAMELQMKEISLNLEQIQIQLQEIPERNTQMLEAYQEAKAKQTMICNAIKSARNDILLPGNLFAADTGREGLDILENTDLAVAGRKFEDWDELIQWFEEMDQRVSDLLEVYRAALAAMVKKAEMLTSQKS